MANPGGSTSNRMISSALGYNFYLEKSITVLREKQRSRDLNTLSFSIYDIRCTPCGCSPAGSTGNKCNNVGVCTQCKRNVEGTKCNLCKQGSTNLENTNPYGCSGSEFHICFCLCFLSFVPFLFVPFSLFSFFRFHFHLP